jgi:crotonobetaine/carnitine-CoA ligase
MVIMESLVTGVPFAIERKFSTSCFWDQVEKHGATIIHLAPSLAEMLLNETTAEENPVRITYGVGGVLSQQFSEQFDCTVVPLYGLTETGGLATSGRSTDPCTGTIGRPTSTVEVTVVDENDEPVPPNTKGEILIRPNQPYAMFQGYYGKPKETQEALRNQWLHTGDIGYYDEEGRFHFAGRKSYFARRKGENVSMNEVERVIDHDERVERVVCVPVSAEVSGEEILAAIILEHNAQMDPEEILELCEEQLAYFKVPRYVRFVDKFPTTATKGNIKRVELADTSLAWDCDAAGYELKK